MDKIIIENPTATTTVIEIQLSNYSYNQVLDVRISYYSRLILGLVLIVTVGICLLLFAIDYWYLVSFPIFVHFLLWIQMRDHFYTVTTPKKVIIVDAEKQTLQLVNYRRCLPRKPEVYKQVVLDIPLSQIENIFTLSRTDKDVEYHDTIISFGRFRKETVHEIDFNLEDGWTAEDIRHLTSTIRELVSCSRPEEITGSVSRVKLPWPRFKNISGKLKEALKLIIIGFFIFLKVLPVIILIGVFIFVMVPIIFP